MFGLEEEDTAYILGVLPRRVLLVKMRLKALFVAGMVTMSVDDSFASGQPCI